MSVSLSSIVSNYRHLDDKKNKNIRVVKNRVFSVSGVYKPSKIFLAKTIFSLNTGNSSNNPYHKKKSEGLTLTTSASYYKDLTAGLAVVQSTGVTHSRVVDLENIYRKKSITKFFVDAKFSPKQGFEIGGAKVSPFANFGYKYTKDKSNLHSHHYDLGTGLLLEYGRFKCTVKQNLEFKKKYNDFENNFGITVAL